MAGKICSSLMVECTSLVTLSYSSLKSCRRPGILVLINDADGELEGEDSYMINAGDSILFVSTLHGG